MPKEEAFEQTIMLGLKSLLDGKNIDEVWIGFAVNFKLEFNPSDPAAPNWRIKASEKRFSETNRLYALDSAQIFVKWHVLLQLKIKDTDIKFFTVFKSLEIHNLS